MVTRQLHAGRAQDRESSPVKDQRSTAVPRNQPSARYLITYLLTYFDSAIFVR